MQVHCLFENRRSFVFEAFPVWSLGKAADHSEKAALKSK